MDRLDGYLAAAVVFAMIDVTRDMAGVGAARFIVW
jgi:hypothetical protein